LKDDNDDEGILEINRPINLLLMDLGFPVMKEHIIV